MGYTCNCADGTFSPVALRCDMRTEFIQNRLVLRKNFAPSPIRNPFRRDFPCQAELLEHRRRFTQILISSSANLPLLVLQSSFLYKLGHKFV